MATPTINTYISDMIALEKHNLQPLQSQAADDELAKYPAAKACVDSAKAMVEAHIDALEARLSALGDHAGVGVKSGVATAAGAVASAINHVRKSEFSKDLRDDYTSLAMASASYTMLHTTALGLKDGATAELALRHLQEVGKHVIKFAEALPPVVLQELEAEGVSIDTSVAGEARANLNEAWTSAERSTSMS